MSDPETLAVYAAKADEYDNLVAASGEKDPARAAFIDALPQGAEVLDLGCGPGNAAAAMARAGLAVTAMDAVPEMVALAARHAGVVAVHGRFEDVGAPSSWEGIWANFSLLHAPRNDLPRHIAAIVSALRPGGLFHIGMKTGKGESRDDIGRLYTYVTESELTGLLTRAGLHVTNRWTGVDKGLSGQMAEWVVLHAVKDA